MYFFEQPVVYSPSHCKRETPQNVSGSSFMKEVGGVTWFD